MGNTPIKSPNKLHSLKFIYENEIRFGPMYFRVVINNYPLKDRVFGDEFKWHVSSEYLALQEWLSTSEKEGPRTVLVIVNLDNELIARVSEAKGGFIKPIKFEGSKIIFEKKYYGKGVTKEYEVNIDNIENWEKL